MLISKVKKTGEDDLDQSIEIHKDKDRTDQSDNDAKMKESSGKK